MEEDSGTIFDKNRPYDLWKNAFTKNEQQTPEYQQVLSPYRGEIFGTDHLNTILQRHRH